MADDKTKTDAMDRNRVAGGQDEVEYFAKHHGISLDQARSLIERFGNDRQALLREVSRLKS
jgi:hypothetical protein